MRAPHRKTGIPAKGVALAFALLGAGLLFGAPTLARAQQGSEAHAREETQAQEPVWWFGLAGAANLNFYGGTTQQLTGQYSTIVPFHKGFGIGPYFAPVLEYRANPVWGAILQLGYDDRRGTWDAQRCPCDSLSHLSARPAYLSLEPSLRLSPFAGDFYLFAGPRLAFLWDPFHREKAFAYSIGESPAVRGDFSKMRSVTYSGQIGAGYDLEVGDWFSSHPGNARTRIQLAPFVSYQPHWGQDPRDTDHDKEWWALSTLRLGAVLKFGRRTPGIVLPDVRFSVRAPARVVAVRRIREVFPLRNYLYFEDDSVEFSGRYTRLDLAQARSFREEQLQDSFPAAPTGRSQRQLAVYHHLLNIVGDRLRRNPAANLTLSGLSARQGPRLGAARAEAAKRYLVRTFGIDPARITTEERDEPAPPLGRTAAELEMLAAENQRVDILSTSREMLLQVGEDDRFMLKPVQIDGEAEGTDSVVFVAAPPHGLELWKGLRPSSFNSSSNASPDFVWTLALTEDSAAGGRTRTFGPFHSARATLPAPLLLGTRSNVRFQATMTGRFGDSPPLVRRGAFSLSQRNQGVHQTLRYGILFDIDQARAVSAYDRFLETEVAPRIADTSTVFIRGRTDVVAPTDYNLKLSQGRAEGVLRNLESAVTRAGKQGVRFQPSWSGEDPLQAPFRNVFPEERNYNRTVIIDLIPDE